MRIRYSRIRIFLFTFTLGIAIVSIYLRGSPYLEGIPVDLPPVDLESPELVCPGLILENTFYLENGSIYFSKEKAINGHQRAIEDGESR